MPTNPDLAALSAAATQAYERAMALADTDCDAETMWEARRENAAAHDRLADTLVNAYRTGNLVQINREGLRERVALALAQQVVGLEFDPFANPEAFDFWCQVADAAIAAILGGE